MTEPLHRDALLVEARRALEMMHPERAEEMFAELERWIPAEGALPSGAASMAPDALVQQVAGAVLHSFPDRGGPIASALLDRLAPWRLLAETTAWCAGRAVGELRTTHLEPQPPLPQRPGVDWFLWGNDATRVSQMSEVARRRREHLPADRPLHPAIPPGRFLLYWPDEQMSDGMSQVSSDGFFDIFDAPPWDTWLHYEPVHHFLVSWVPLAFVQHAAIGISRNEIDCHAWLDEVAQPDHARHPLRIAFSPWLRALADRPFP